MTDKVFFNGFETTIKSMESVNSDERYFEGLLTVQMKDKQGEVTIVDELYKVLPVWIDRGAPISDTHSNRIVGKGISYSRTMVKAEDGEELPAIKIVGKIFKNYELDNLIWDKIKSGEYKGLSFGGATRANRSPISMKDGSTAYALKDLEHYEVAVCKDPAVPMAIITDYNPIAKSLFTSHIRDEDKMVIQCSNMGCYVEKDALVKIEDEDDKNTEVEVLDEWKNDDNDSGEETKKADHADADGDMKNQASQDSPQNYNTHTINDKQAEGLKPDKTIPRIKREFEDEGHGDPFDTANKIAPLVGAAAGLTRGAAAGLARGAAGSLLSSDDDEEVEKAFPMVSPNTSSGSSGGKKYRRNANRRMRESLEESKRFEEANPEHVGTTVNSITGKMRKDPAKNRHVDPYKDDKAAREADKKDFQEHADKDITTAMSSTFKASPQDIQQPEKYGEEAGVQQTSPAQSHTGNKKQHTERFNRQEGDFKRTNMARAGMLNTDPKQAIKAIEDIAKVDLGKIGTFQGKVDALMREGYPEENAKKIVGAFVKGEKKKDGAGMSDGGNSGGLESSSSGMMNPVHNARPQKRKDTRKIRKMNSLLRLVEIKRTSSTQMFGVDGIRHNHGDNTTYQSSGDMGGFSKVTVRNANEKQKKGKITPKR